MRDRLQPEPGASGAARGNAPVWKSQRWGNTAIASFRQKDGQRPVWGGKAAAHSRHSIRKRAYQAEGGNHVQRVTYHTAARRQNLDQWRLGDSWTDAGELGGPGPHGPGPALISISILPTMRLVRKCYSTESRAVLLVAPRPVALKKKFSSRWTPPCRVASTRSCMTRKPDVIDPIIYCICTPMYGCSVR